MTDTHIMIVGDSEALGFQNTGPAPYTPTAQVQIWTRQADGSFNWNYMLPGVNTGTPANPTAWGQEVKEANDWLQVHAGDGSHLWIVKDELTVKGGTTLAVDWQLGAMWFENATTAAQGAISNLRGGPFAFDHYDAVFVDLGTNDAVVSADAQAFEANLERFLPAARQAWSAEHFVMARIDDTMGAAADNLAVRVAQWNEDQEDPGLATFKTIGFELQADQVHFDATGQLELGDGFWTTAAQAGWVA